MRIGAVGAAHRAFMAAQGLGEFDRHAAAGRVVGLAPVEGDAERGAAGAATHAGMDEIAGRHAVIVRQATPLWATMAT